MELNTKLSKREKNIILGINILFVLIGFVSIILNYEPISHIRDYNKILSSVSSIFEKAKLIFIIILRVIVLFFGYYFIIKQVWVALLLSLPIIGPLLAIYLYKKT